MKITKTIQKLLDQVDISNLPIWETGGEPIKKWAIIENQSIPNTKKCSFCGEEVPLTWEINKKMRIKDPDYLPENHSDGYTGMLPGTYRVALDMHPKCKKLRELFQQWGVTEKNAFKTDDFIVCDENKEAFLRVTEWINEPSTTGLYFFGSPGVGKSLLATKIILDSNQQNKMIISETELYDQLTPRIYDKGSQKEIDSFMSEIMRTSLLIIDDLGTCKKTDWKMETLFAVISKRIDRALTTFFTSNYSPAELLNLIDSKIVSRVFELANPCFVGGYDHRLVR